MVKNRTKILAAAAVMLLSACAPQHVGRDRPSGEAGGYSYESGSGTAMGNQTAVPGTRPVEIRNRTSLGWDTADTILEQVYDPAFPGRCVDVTDYGAVPDDGRLDTESIQAAVDQVSAMGGGMVVVPSGTYDTGAVVLKENVNLHLKEEDTVLRFTKEIVPENYPLVLAYYEGAPCYNWSPLIYAYGQDNIAVTGKGKLDGQADRDTWWSWYGEENIGQDYSRPSSSDVGILRRMTDDGVDVKKRVFGEGHFLRPNFIQVIGCENVLVEGISIENSPMWGVNPVLCSNVTVRGITVRAGFNNNDGCNPENCNYVLIENCRFQVGGDGIAVKSGRNRDGWELREKGMPARNMVIRNNEFISGASGIAFGSEMSGDIRDIYADSNVFGGGALDYAIRFKSNAARGGVVEDIYIRGSQAKDIRYVSIHATVLYDEGWMGSHLPEYRNIRIEDFKGNGGAYGIFMEAFEQVPISGLELVDVEIRDVDCEVRARNWEEPVLENVCINGNVYPRPIDTRVEGDFFAGETVRAAGELPGADRRDLSYEWRLSYDGDEEAIIVGAGEVLEITGDMEGGRLVLAARDASGNEDTSMPYRILDREETAAVEDITIRAALSRGYVDAAGLNPDAAVTRRECERMFERFWEMDGGRWPMDGINGVSGSPDEPVARDEMGQIALLSCGIPYEELMIVWPDYEDAADIRPVYRSAVGVSSYLGFVKAKEADDYRPADILTQRELIGCVMAVSGFNRR